MLKVGLFSSWFVLVLFLLASPLLFVLQGHSMFTKSAHYSFALTRHPNTIIAHRRFIFIMCIELLTLFTSSEQLPNVVTIIQCSSFIFSNSFFEEDGTTTIKPTMAYVDHHVPTPNWEATLECMNGKRVPKSHHI